MPANRLPWVWDYEIDELELRALPAGERTIGRLDQHWAAVRLLEYGSYRDVVFSAIRRRGLDFLVAWHPEHHPELVTAPWMSGTGWS